MTALIGTVTNASGGCRSGTPVAVTNWTAYTDAFGGYKASLNLPFAVRGFFENGGTLAYIVPIKDPTGVDGALDALTRLPDVSIVCAARGG